MSIDPFVQLNLLNLWLLARTCSVVIARTESVEPPTGIWSGSEKGVQEVSIVVEQTIYGEAPEDPKLQLAMPLAEGTRIAAATPAVATWISTPGSRVVYFLEKGQLADEDLGAFRADPELVEYLRKLCNGPIPAGTGSVFYQLSQLAQCDPDVKAGFADLPPSVMDIVEKKQAVARVTIVTGKIRVFTGIRLKRVIKSREPDITLQANATDVASVLTEQRDIGDLVVKGAAPALLSALERAAGVIAQDPKHSALIIETARR